MKRTAKQNSLLYKLLNEHKLGEEEKQQLALQYTNRRTSKTSEMTAEEVAKLIRHLMPQNQTAENLKKKRSKVLYIAVALGLGNDKGEVDWNRFNEFMLNTSKHKKPLKKYTSTELDELITQLEQIQKKTPKAFATNHKTPEGHGNNHK